MPSSKYMYIATNRHSLHFVLYLKYAGHNVTAEEVRDMELEVERENK